MSDNGTNGHDANAEGMSRILSIKDAKNAPRHALTRAQRAEVERLAYDMVIQECAKVHEHYLTQIPHFVARMIQDALLTYGLIQPQLGTDIAPAGSSEAAGIGMDNTVVPQSEDAASNPGEPSTLTPADAPVDPAA